MELRRKPPHGAQLIFVGMNPSTATDFGPETDPTVEKIRKWVDNGIFDALENFNGRVTVVNLVSLTVPSLKKVSREINNYGGTQNHQLLSQRAWSLALDMAENAHVISIWGYCNPDTDTKWKLNFLPLISNALTKSSKVLSLSQLTPEYPLHPQVLQGMPSIAEFQLQQY